MKLLAGTSRLSGPGDDQAGVLAAEAEPVDLQHVDVGLGGCAGFATDEVKRPETLADATVGYSTLGCEIAILDPDGNPVPPGE